MAIFKIKRFARADYAGLSESQKVALKMERDEIARELAKQRRKSNKTLLESGKERLMDQRSYEHQRFVNDGLLRDNRVTKDALGQIETRNYFGKKKSHSDEEIRRLMNKDRGFIGAKVAQAEAHEANIAHARTRAKAAREGILNKPSLPANSVGSQGILPQHKSTSYSPTSTFTGGYSIKPSLKRSANSRRLSKAGKYAGVATLGIGLGYGAHRILNKKEENSN